MAKEIGPKEKQLRAMREARLAETQRVAPAPIHTTGEKPKVVKRKSNKATS